MLIISLTEEFNWWNWFIYDPDEKPGHTVIARGREDLYEEASISALSAYCAEKHKRELAKGTP